MSEYRTISVALKNKTSLWWQTEKSNGYPVGCGPTAWAIVFGYWKQYKGRNRLLDGITMPHSQTGSTDADLSKHMEEIAKDTETTYGSYGGGYGRTTPSKMLKAKKYIKRRDYSCSIERILGTEFTKFRKVKAWLLKDRPVIILSNDPAQALTTLHYPVIEKAKLVQRKRLGRWRDRSVRYYVNLGNSRRKWIWVREVGPNEHSHTGSFSMFLLNIN